MKTLEERKKILDTEITKHLTKGWQISNRSETSCQLKQDIEQDSSLEQTLLFLFTFLLPRQKETKSLFIEVDEEGKVRYIRNDL